MFKMLFRPSYSLSECKSDYETYIVLIAKDISTFINLFLWDIVKIAESNLLWRDKQHNLFCESYQCEIEYCLLEIKEKPRHACICLPLACLEHLRGSQRYASLWAFPAWSMKETLSHLSFVLLRLQSEVQSVLNPQNKKQTSEWLTLLWCLPRRPGHSKQVSGKVVNKKMSPLWPLPHL